MDFHVIEVLGISRKKVGWVKINHCTGHVRHGGYHLQEEHQF
jgi:hypothetical protein